MKIRYLILSSACLVSGAPAIAQTASDTPTDQAEQSGIADIVVTAERREQNVQKASLTIQVVDSGQLLDAGIANATDLGKIAPGVDINNGGSSTQIFVRGVGDFSFNPLANPGVAFNVDGVYVGRTDGIGGSFYDLARVEVLKGPQGTLYGRNANGGSINLITNEPRLEATTLEGTLEAGNFSFVHATGAANLPVGNTAALRFAYNLVHRDGYLSDGSGDDVQQSGRLRFKWEPSSDFTLMLNGDYTHLGGRGGGYVYLPRRPGSDPWEAAGSPEGVAYRQTFPPVGPLLDTSPGVTNQNTKLWNVSAQADWKLPFATLTVVPAYRDTDVESRTYPGFQYYQPNRAKQKSLEVRLGDSLPSGFTWVIGGFAFRETVAGAIDLFESDIVQNTLITYRPRTTAFAGFGQATLPIFDHFRVIGGIRYTYEKRRLDGDYIDNRPVPYGPGPGTVLEHFDSRANFDGITYKGGFEYDLGPRNLLFATISTGFKAGGLNETVPPAAVYQPEKLRSIEFGSRNRFLDNHLQVNFGLYHWKYRGLQDQRVTFDPTGNINFLFFNVGNATIKGATFDLIAKPTSADTLTASVEYADSQYNSFAARVPTAVFLPGSIGCPTHIEGTQTVADCSGYQVARVPKWTGTAGYSHVFTLPDDATIKIDGDVKFSTARWIATDFIPAERAKGYAVFNAGISYTPADERITIAAFIRNIGNRAYHTGGFEHPFLPGLFAANIAAPRTYGVRLSYKFGE